MRTRKMVIIGSVLSVAVIILAVVMLSQAIKISNEREKSTPDIGRIISNYDKYSERLKSEKINAKIEEDDKRKYLVIEDEEKVKYYFTDFDSCDIEFSGSNNGDVFEAKIYITNMKKSYAKVDVTGRGGAGWCGYNIDNFEEPIEDPGEYKKWDKFIKSNVPTERLNRIGSNARTYFKKMEEISVIK